MCPFQLAISDAFDANQSRSNVLQFVHLLWIHWPYKLAAKSPSSSISYKNATGGSTIDARVYKHEARNGHQVGRKIPPYHPLRLQECDYSIP